MQSGWVSLGDVWPNLPGTDAVYTDWLVLNAGAKIDLNGHALYYRNGGAPKRLYHGDANLNGQVDDADLNLLLSHWGDGTAAPAVPEPTVLVLLAAGLLAFRRR